MKLSQKDLLIFLGIVVAVIIGLTTLVFSDGKLAREAELPEVRKTSLNQVATDLLKKVTHRAQSASFGSH